MNFFQQLSETQITDVIIQFEKAENGQVTVFIAPKAITRGNPLKSINPIFLSGSAQKVDDEFFEILDRNMIDAPIKKEVAKKIVKGHESKPTIKDEEIPSNTMEQAMERMEMPNEAMPQAMANIQQDDLQEQEAEEEAERQLERDAELLGNDFTSEEIAEAVEELKEELEIKKPEKVVKINNEKPLKDFITSLGKDADILPHIPQIEELYANLSPEELDKPYAKKVRIDVDIRLRKDANYRAALEKNGFAPKLPEKLQEIVDASPNIHVVTMAPIEEPVDAEKMEMEIKLREIDEEIENVAEVHNAQFIDIDMTTETHVFDKPIEISAEMQALVETLPPAEEVFEVEAVEEEPDFVMIAKDFTLEQYISVGWTKQSLVDANRAKFVYPEAPKIPTPPPAPIPAPPIPSAPIKYTFPKPFDEMTEQEQMEEEEYQKALRESNQGKV